MRRVLPVSPSFVLAVALAPMLPLAMLGCGSAESDLDELGESSSELRNCPPSDPDYPTCSVPTDPCINATGTLTAASSSVAYGQSTSLSWTAKIPAACHKPLMMGGSVVGRTGSTTVSPMSSATYSLHVGSVTIATAHVDVVLPATVHIEGNTPQWRGLLLQALATPHTRVVLGANVDMDLTGYSNIPIVDGVTLTSEGASPVVFADVTNKLGGAVGRNLLRRPIDIFGPRPPLRDASHLGPRLYTTERPKPLFSMSCPAGNFESNDIHVTGFRIQGPDFDTMDGDDKLERGIQIDSCLGVEVSDMELSGWSGAAVYVADSQWRQLGPDTVVIHDNFIHHNQHEGGNGYGVDVGAGAYARIEHNVFDHNRHAITASGKPGTGYWANGNLILKGGGHHDKWYNEYTHLMDVHGDANCPDIPGNQHSWLCGNAGDQFWMTNNAFQYTNDYAIKIRGTPVIDAQIYGNVFTQSGRDDAIDTTQGFTHIDVGTNTYGVDTFGDYGVCDFDGDGKDDLFLATGASWWMMSGGKMHWSYLAPYTERLSQVRLGDFDGDHHCDVLAINHGTNAWEIARGGSGPWTALPGTYAGIGIDELATGDLDGDHVTDVFRRAPDGQWWAISPGHYDWTALQSSSTPLSDLKLGDFNGDGVTDVLGKNGGAWAISWGGRSAWQPAGSGLGDDVTSVLIANVDGVAGDDVVRYHVISASEGRWEFSSGAHTGWQTLASFSWPSTTTAPFPVTNARTFVGNFDGAGSADVLMIDAATRIGRLASAGSSAFSAYGLYTY